MVEVQLLKSLCCEWNVTYETENCQVGLQRMGLNKLELLSNLRSFTFSRKEKNITGALIVLESVGNSILEQLQRRVLG